MVYTRDSLSAIPPQYFYKFCVRRRGAGREVERKRRSEPNDLQEEAEMATTNLETSRQRPTSSDNGVERRPARFLTATETRRSFMTSEFWVTIAMAVTLVVVGYANDDGLGIDRAWALAAGIVGLYILSRGIAKAGSSDPQVRDLDDLT